MPAGLANRIVGGTGDVDSALLAQGMWSLGRVVAADPALSATFDEGLDGVAERTAGTALQTAIDGFLAEHGHRGPDEYELATPAWIMDPTPIYAAVDRLRHAPASRDPAIVADRLAADAEDALAEAVDALATAPAPLDPPVCDGGPAGLDRTRAGQGHPRARESRCSPRAARTGAPGCRARWPGGRRPRVLRHGDGAGRLRRPAERLRRRDRRSRRAPALPRRTHPAGVVRRPHHRSRHVAATSRLPPAGAGRRLDRRGHRRERRHGVGTGAGHPRPRRPTRPRARRRPRLPDHRPVVDTTVPRRRRRGRATRAPCRATRRSSPASSASRPC